MAEQRMRSINEKLAKYYLSACHLLLHYIYIFVRSKLSDWLALKWPMFDISGLSCGVYF